MSISLGNYIIKNDKYIKILGITFDSKCSWAPHIRQACTNRLNIIKMLSHTSWGAHLSVLLKIHKSLILSKIDYGSPLFSSAIQCHLKKLENIHNSGMRLAIGAFRSSPIDSISNIAEIPSLSLEWAEQKSLLAARIHRSPQGISTSPNNLFSNLQAKLNLDQIIPSTISLQPTWTITLDINLELHHIGLARATGP
ncbi:putative RNA-directed DNA polymerase [Aphis craccivora]|uniref:Putative RNA-directed DNA polymerase n=1 Tax=Aphis craccivora TaxID=307492 RepID=A0A6G0YXZ8_APHCR|nr:putative RNA-directed DNA polymerase [Aphis craccivora]